MSLHTHAPSLARRHVRHLLLSLTALVAVALPLRAQESPPAATPALPATKASTQPAVPQTFRAPEIVSIATYNVENWRNHFEAERLTRANAPVPPEVLRLLRSANDENNWQVARVLQQLSPDIVLFQESAGLDDLKFFNNRWLSNAYETIHVFKTNSGRGQELSMFVKPGFKVLEIREDYHLEPDPDPAGRTPTTSTGGDESGPAGQPPRLFARGPGFALIEGPSGHKFWVGNTHQKSKSGNSVDVTRWRNREAQRTVEIIKELRATGHPVIFVGDFNDELGVQEFEADAGGSTVEIFTAKPENGLVLATQTLEDQNLISFQGYFRDRYRSLIDHIVITDDLKPALTDVRVDRSPWAEVASDHLPVIATFDLSKLPSK